MRTLWWLTAGFFFIWALTVDVKAALLMLTACTIDVYTRIIPIIKQQAGE